MANRNYLVVSDGDNGLIIDGVCGTLERAEKICATFNERANQGGKCFSERRVMVVNNYDGEIEDDGKRIVRKVTVRFKRSGKGGSTIIGGAVVNGFRGGICYYDGKNRKPVITTDGKTFYLVDLYTDKDDPGYIIQSALDAINERLAEQEAAAKAAQET